MTLADATGSAYDISYLMGRIIGIILIVIVLLVIVRIVRNIIGRK